MALILGIGHKARNGKDETANAIKRNFKNVEIIHWADDLYVELKNEARKFPLIIKVDTGFLIWNKSVDEDSDSYKVFNFDEMPELHSLWESRGWTDSYWGMDEKDSPMLQFWGTQYRRRLDDLYWVNKTKKNIENIIKSKGEDVIICIPDTRFLNECEALMGLRGYYIRVKRMLPDGTQFISTDRDPNHPSEVQLDGIHGDITMEILDGRLDQLEQCAIEIVRDLTFTEAVAA